MHALLPFPCMAFQQAPTWARILTRGIEKIRGGALRSKHADKRIEDCKRLRGENATSCTASRLRAEVAETRARVKMLIAAASKMTVGTEARDAAASTHK